MFEKLRANFLADLRYYQRSRLLLAFVLLFLLVTGLSALPSLFYPSGVEKFNTLRSLFSEINLYILILSGGLGLFIMSFHIRNRSLKMVFTKPCSPAMWLLSAILSAATVSLLLNLVVFSSVVVLSYSWHLPVRAGLFFMSAYTFIASLGVISYLILLGTLVHPAVAVAIILIFNADTFFWAQTWAQASGVNP